ncbi:hypothetical protein WICPIJ_006610 [Wickerhamomyces pijperi]|uniref:RING-14 protein n=1 Tax=Wickerhamomyces pijperi TaxID=599730 RepID=A0A9P8Q441_WICPI|nr:hypothetical protein WICPIJ_006610 [Wickerhamomyces pijperi]
MKFGKTYEKTLQDEHIPTEWIDRSIHYKLLKKKINQVVAELHERGIDQAIAEQHVNYVYKFTANDKVVSPRLIEISPDDDSEIDNISLNSSVIQQHKELILNKDRVFFQELYDQHRQMNKLMSLEEKKLEQLIAGFAAVVKKLLDQKKKKDVGAWREIFAIYMEFKLDLSREFNLSKFEAFVQHLQKTKVLSRLKKDNLKMFDTFHQLNYSLLQFLTFKNLNKVALRKIIKKFDKNTLLKSSTDFTRLIESTNSNQLTLISGNSIEQIICTDIIKILPQLDDYLCPICASIAYKPIRLACSHFFCVRCLIKLQRQGENKCPLCRDPHLMYVTDQNLDTQMMVFMEENFPEEVKLKRKINDKEVTDETLKALGYNPNRPCCIM